MRQSHRARVYPAMTAHETPRSDQEQVVPLHVEELSVSVRSVITGRVRVHVRTHEREQTIDEPAATTHVEIERVTIGRVVDAHPPIREEGDTTIIPVVEEMVVVERRLVLKEEIRLTRVTTHTQRQQTILLREEQATIERLPG